ncbi:hypothetical protein NDU88_001253 [Pleurodeles waltl]|uniref:Uncharacterized protein n=1 Tax=Pleurodeles waltl TaxID=8319 RepID=A0AAV7R977_PLEWA|nr:hypothetical protein NDU88_001253 [Pleurodeles waltl]
METGSWLRVPTGSSGTRKVTTSLFRRGKQKKQSRGKMCCDARAQCVLTLGSSIARSLMRQEPGSPALDVLRLRSLMRLEPGGRALDVLRLRSLMRPEPEGLALDLYKSPGVS